MSYGYNTREATRSAADIVDKILRGAKASEIPIQQATTFQLIINLTTAKALGLSQPMDCCGTPHFAGSTRAEPRRSHSSPNSNKKEPPPGLRAAAELDQEEERAAMMPSAPNLLKCAKSHVGI